MQIAANHIERDKLDRKQVMPGSNHGPSIKFPRAYDAMRMKGYSKEKAAKISNWMARIGMMGRKKGK